MPKACQRCPRVSRQPVTHTSWYAARRPSYKSVGHTAQAPLGLRYEGRNVVTRFLIEFRQQFREGDPAARSGACFGRIRIGCLTDGTDVQRTSREAA